MLAIYSRQSTNKQQSIPLQMELGEKFAAKNNLQFQHYVEKGISGGAKIENRIEFTRLLDDLQDGKVDKVFIWVQDRAEREPLTWHTLCNAIIEANAQLYENGQVVELENDLVYTMRGITSLMNRAERRKNNKRIKEKLVNNAEKGRIFAMVPYGYKKDDDNKMVVCPIESPIIKTIFELSIRGNGYSAIAKHLNENEIPTRYNKLGGSYDVDINRNNNLPKKTVTKIKSNTKWVSGTVKNMLHNRTYIGERTFSGQTYDCPKIIDELTFKKVHDNIANKKKKTGKRSKNNYVLNDLVFCVDCGKRYTGRRVNKHEYYRCASLLKSGGSCGNRGIKVELLEAFVWGRFFLEGELLELVKNNLKETDTVLKIDDCKADIGKKETELSNLDEKRKKIVGLIIEDIITKEDGKGQLKSVENLKDRLEQDIINLKENLDSLISAAAKKTEINTDINKLKNNISYIKKKDIIEKYIERVSIMSLPINRSKVEYLFTVHFKLPMEPEQYITKNERFYPFTEELTVN